MDVEVVTSNDLLTEKDVQKIEHSVFMYTPLPASLENHLLEPECSYDASLNLLGRFEWTYFLCEQALPKLLACTNLEYLRRVISVILTCQRVVALTDELSGETNPSSWVESDENPLQKCSERLRTMITPIFELLMLRLKLLGDPGVVHSRFKHIRDLI